MPNAISSVNWYFCREIH